jgi:electron transfer flavoprotein beta subunit
MKVGVCIKSTPDADTRIKIAAGATGIETAGIKWVISDYEKAALEQGAQLKEKLGGECVLYSVGSGDTEKNLRDGLALGADRAVMVDDPATKGTDALGVAKALAAAIKADGLDLVLCGRQATDDENVQVPAMLAELLGWPHVSITTALSIEGNEFLASRNMGGATEKVRGALPVVISAEDTLATPRYVKLPEIMKAKAKKLEKKNLAALGLSAAEVAPATTFVAFGPPPARPAGKKLTGDLPSQVKELVRLLREEAKVI